jgi:hypothetical protein
MRPLSILGWLMLGALAGCAPLKPNASTTVPSQAAAPAPSRSGTAPLPVAAPAEVPAPAAAATAAAHPAPPVQPTPSKSSTVGASGLKPKPPAAPTAAAPASKPAPVAPAPVVAPTPPAAPSLDLSSLEQRLRDTRAIGLFTKLSIKNQVDDLLNRFRSFYRGELKTPLSQLRQQYELVLLKVMTVLQDGDPKLAAAVLSSREAIWGILADPKKFAQI